MHDFYSDILGHLKKDLPFTVYRMPGGSELRAILQQDDKIYSPSFDEAGFVFSPFDSLRKSVFIPLEKSLLMHHLISENDFEAGSEETTGLDKSDATWNINESREQHVALINKAIKVLETGELDKVVLSRKERISLKNDLDIIFRDLIKTYPSAFVYWWFHPKVGCWMGASPETLLQLDGHNFRTMALAATQQYSGEIKVEWGAKEKQEQQYVTDSIVDNLKELKVMGKIKFSGPYTVRAGELLHLRTDITGNLESTGNLEQLIQSLHPTPAVCGLPKEKAKGFILKEEGYDREFYTGFLGEVNFQEKRNRSRHRRNVENLAYVSLRKRTSLFVNLRCMKLETNEAHIFVGGGITRDSVPEEEYQETVNKAQTMKKVLRK